jgi:hypothetical protein
VDEQQWLSCDDPTPMLKLLRGKASERKLRLFLAACCRRIWDFLPDECCREAVLLAEQLAYGKVRDRQRRANTKQVTQALPGYFDNPIELNARLAVLSANEKTMWRKVHFPNVAMVLGHAASQNGDVLSAAYKDAVQLEKQAEASLVRCIFGSPFRPRLSPDLSILAWNGGIVKRLAEEAYEQRIMPAGTLDNARLAVLADALEEAGCQDPDLLGHLRQPGAMHVRGCWPVDWIREKS